MYCVRRDEPSTKHTFRKDIKAVDEHTYVTLPRLSSVFFVSSVRGVEARTQTSPVESRTAVDLPPTGTRLKRAKGLELPSELYAVLKSNEVAYLENVQTPSVT